MRLYIVLSFLGAGRETVKICTGNGIKIKINDPSQLAPAKAGSRDAGWRMSTKSLYRTGMAGTKTSSGITISRNIFQVQRFLH